MNIVTRDIRDLTDVSPISFQWEEKFFMKRKLHEILLVQLKEMIQWNFYFVWI